LSFGTSANVGLPPPVGERMLPTSKRAPPVTEVLEYRPYEDGYLQQELPRYIRRGGSTRERGPCWFFHFQTVSKWDRY
jgi:hypothetical protein